MRTFFAQAGRRTNNDPGTFLLPIVNRPQSELEVEALRQRHRAGQAIRRRALDKARRPAAGLGILPTPARTAEKVECPLSFFALTAACHAEDVMYKPSVEAHYISCGDV